MSSIDPNAIPTDSFSWGIIKWFITPDRTPGAGITLGEVVMQAGEGHGRHNHPNAEEVLYVLSGVGVQMVDDGPPFPVAAGDVIHIPTGIYHSTQNTGWAPMRVIAIYNPGGPEKALRSLADFREVEPGEPPVFIRKETV